MAVQQLMDNLMAADQRPTDANLMTDQQRPMDNLMTEAQSMDNLMTEAQSMDNLTKVTKLFYQVNKH